MGSSFAYATTRKKYGHQKSLNFLKVFDFVGELPCQTKLGFEFNRNYRLGESLCISGYVQIVLNIKLCF